MLSKFWDAKTARVLCTILLFATVLACLHAAQGTLTLFLFAILFAYFLDPLVTKLTLPLRGRTPAIAAVFIISLSALIGLGFLLGPKIVEEAKALSSTLPSLLPKVQSGELLAQVGTNQGMTRGHRLEIRELFIAHRDDILDFEKALGAKLAVPAQHIWWLVLIPILSLFFLKSGSSLSDGLVGMGSCEEDKQSLRGVVGDVHIMLGSYIRAQLLLSGLTLVSYTTVLSLIRVPYAFVLGPLAGLFEFLPIIGPAVAALTALAVAILSNYPHPIWVVLFLASWRILQDYVNSPKIMGDSLEMSPLVQIFAVLAGGEIAGVIGALISVPVVAILGILWRRMSSGQGVDAEIVDPLPPIK